MATSSDLPRRSPHDSQAPRNLRTRWARSLAFAVWASDCSSGSSRISSSRSSAKKYGCVRAKTSMSALPLTRCCTYASSSPTGPDATLPCVSLCSPSFCGASFGCLSALDCDRGDSGGTPRSALELPHAVGEPVPLRGLESVRPEEREVRHLDLKASRSDGL